MMSREIYLNLYPYLECLYIILHISQLSRQVNIFYGRKPLVLRDWKVFIS